MNDQDVRKLISMVKTMPESQKLLRNLILDYLAIKEDNQKLVRTNNILLEDMKQYEFLLSEEEPLTIN